MRPRLVLFAALVLTAVSCDSTEPKGGPGTVTAVLVSPNGPEGAAVLDVNGVVESFTATNDVSVYTTPSSTGTRVVLVRVTPGELSVKMKVSNTLEPPPVTVVEVAGGDDKLRASVSGYQVAFQ